jgi:predicted ThiF/HesA family dinucleotide-utilizing enzyme
MESQTKKLKKGMWSGCGVQALNLSFAELYEIHRGGMSRCPLCTKKNRG